MAFADAPKDWLEAIAGERRPSESMKAMLVRISRSIPMEYGRVKRIWYGETDNLAWREADMLRRRAQEETRRRWEIMAQRKSLAEWKSDLERTRHHAAEISRRVIARESDDRDGQEDKPLEQLAFWLGRDASGLD